MKGKIFIIEDEASIVQLIQHNLEKEGFTSTKHQREVGAEYFDKISSILSDSAEY